MNRSFWTKTRQPDLDTCDTLDSLLSLYADRMASPEEARRVDAHLPGCEACRETLRWTQATRQALIARPAALPPPDLQARIAGAIAASSAVPVQARPAARFALRPAYAAAASLTVLGAFLAGHALLTTPHGAVSPPRKVQVAVQPPPDVSAPPQTRPVPLPAAADPHAPTAPVVHPHKEMVATLPTAEAAAPPVFEAAPSLPIRSSVPGNRTMPPARVKPTSRKSVPKPAAPLLAVNRIPKAPALERVLPPAPEVKTPETLVATRTPLPDAPPVTIGTPTVASQELPTATAVVASNDLLGTVREHIGEMRTAAFSTTRQSIKQAGYVAQVSLTDKVPGVVDIHGSLH